MKNRDTYGVRKPSLEEVFEWIAGWNDKTGLGKRLIDETGLRRRISRLQGIGFRIAIGIAPAALIIAIFKG